MLYVLLYVLGFMSTFGVFLWYLSVEFDKITTHDVAFTSFISLFSWISFISVLAVVLTNLSSRRYAKVLWKRKPKSYY
jgi:hypothetical protein